MLYFAQRKGRVVKFSEETDRLEKRAALGEKPALERLKALAARGDVDESVPDFYEWQNVLLDASRFAYQKIKDFDDYASDFLMIQGGESYVLHNPSGQVPHRVEEEVNGPYKYNLLDAKKRETFAPTHKKNRAPKEFEDALWEKANAAYLALSKVLPKETKAILDSVSTMSPKNAELVVNKVESSLSRINDVTWKHVGESAWALMPDEIHPIELALQG